MAQRQCIVCEASVDADPGAGGHLLLSAFEEHCICADCLQADHPG